MFYMKQFKGSGYGMWDGDVGVGSGDVFA